MNQTRNEYITAQHDEFRAEGMKEIDYIHINLDQEYYSILETHIKQGGTITNNVYNSLTSGQQFHFNKHYNFRADKVINSDYEQAIQEGTKQAEKDFLEYLLEQTQKQIEQEIKEQKIKKQTITQLKEELQQLQNNLFDYNNLSPIGKRNINKLDHAKRQNKIIERITEIEERIKGA